MAKSYRKGRLGEEIKKLIADLLMKDLKDPGLVGMVSVTDVTAAADGSYATVYLSVFCTPADLETKTKEECEASVIEAMQRSKGFIKREIGKKIKMHNVPELAFKIDSSLEYGRHMDELIAKVMS